MDARRRLTARFGTASLLAVLAVAAACDAGPSAQSPPSPATSAATPSTLAPTTIRTPDVTGTPPRSTGPESTQQLVTLRGTLVEGVEGGCLILNADNGLGYQLIGLDDGMSQPGARLEVRGYKAVGMYSSCMQGILFKVVSARRI
ncbi:hypothetical protein [Luedemannella helvata]|uniref:Lipoprotein n=1 Tax=Luedemannella helvata TaxID=349315 RepID=A0ABN2KJ53_9ACTN